MVTTISTGFQKLRENLEITGLQKTTVSERQQNVREAMEKDLEVLDSFLSGSYSRFTMIAPLGEADNRYIYGFRPILLCYRWTGCIA